MPELSEHKRQSFGGLIRRVRLERGLTLNETAALADMCSMRLSRIERAISAAPTRYEIARLAYVFAQAEQKPERVLMTFNQLLASAGIISPEHKCLWLIYDHLITNIEDPHGKSQEELDFLKYLADYAYKILPKPAFYEDEVDHRKFLEDYDANTKATL